MYGILQRAVESSRVNFDGCSNDLRTFQSSFYVFLDTELPHQFQAMTDTFQNWSSASETRIQLHFQQLQQYVQQVAAQNSSLEARLALATQATSSNEASSSIQFASVVQGIKEEMSSQESVIERLQQLFTTHDYRFASKETFSSLEERVVAMEKKFDEFTRFKDTAAHSITGLRTKLDALAQRVDQLAQGVAESSSRLTQGLEEVRNSN